MQGNLAQIAAEVQNGQGLTFAEAAKSFPGRGGRRVNPSTVFRWHRDGVMAPQGRVRLEAVRLGSRLLTSSGAIGRFLEQLNPTMVNSGDSVRTPAQRRRAAEEAARELEELGC